MSDSNNPYQPPRSPSPSEERRAALLRQGDEPASRGNRLLASILDTFANGLVLLPVMQYMGLFEREISFRDQLTVFLLGFLCIILIHGYLLHTRGQTIGKAIVGIQIVGLDGARVSLSRIVFRRYLPIQLAAMIQTVGSLLGLLDIIWIFRDDRRCLHDHIAGTVVVNYLADRRRES